MSTVTYASVPFNLDSEKVNQWLDATISLDEMRVTTAQRPYPGPNLLGCPYPWRYPHRPALRVGQLFYPTGASRWAEYVGLVSEDNLADMTSAAFTSAGATSNDFVMSDGTNTITIANCFLLPPKPLAAFGGLTGLYLVTVVDERYYWQYINGGALAVTGTTHWSDLYNSLAVALGITLTYDTIPSAYGQPEPDSDLNSNYENAAVLLDACAFNVGQVIVRAYGPRGTYSAYSNDSSDRIITANLGLSSVQLAGGDALTP